MDTPLRIVAAPTDQESRPRLEPQSANNRPSVCLHPPHQRADTRSYRETA